MRPVCPGACARQPGCSLARGVRAGGLVARPPCARWVRFPPGTSRRWPLSLPRRGSSLTRSTRRSPALLRRCREHCAAGDLEGAWRAMTHAAWRVTAAATGAHAPGKPPLGHVVWERPEHAARAELQHRDPREGFLRRHEAALAALMAAARAGALTPELRRAALVAVSPADAVRLRCSPDCSDVAQGLLVATQERLRRLTGEWRRLHAWRACVGGAARAPAPPEPPLGAAMGSCGASAARRQCACIAG